MIILVVLLLKVQIPLECGGVLTEAPGQIQLQFISSQPAGNVHCTWKLQSPSGYHAFVRSLTIVHDVPYDESEDENATNFNSMVVKIYDGDTLDPTKQLFA